nr:hypothetical protein [Rhodococcus qingshengii]
MVAYHLILNSLPLTLVIRAGLSGRRQPLIHFLVQQPRLRDRLVLGAYTPTPPHDAP